jgi:hypothetical protein
MLLLLIRPGPVQQECTGSSSLIVKMEGGDRAQTGTQERLDVGQGEEG